MKRSSFFLKVATLNIALLTGAALSQNAPQNPTPVAKPAAKPAQHLQSQDDGQRVFEQNCSRCHTAPDGFSPRISGTVARHMRVRASLSRADEQALLHFLNP
jgi:mono/diheme cytochrome c family protein